MQRFIADKRTDLAAGAVPHTDAELQADAQRMEAAREQDRLHNAQREQDRQQEREQLRQRDQEIQQGLSEHAREQRELADRRAASTLYDF